MKELKSRTIGNKKRPRWSSKRRRENTLFSCMTDKEIQKSYEKYLRGEE